MVKNKNCSYPLDRKQTFLKGGLIWLSASLSLQFINRLVNEQVVVHFQELPIQ